MVNNFLNCVSYDIIYTMSKISSRNKKPEFYQSDILESISDAFFAVDSLWNFTYINAHAEKLLKKNKKDILGKNIWELYPKSKDSIYFKKYTEALETKKSVEFEVFYEPSNKYFQFHVYPTKDGLSIYFTDITDKKLYQKELELANLKAKTAEENLIRLFTEAPALIGILEGIEGKVTLFNPEFKKLWGNRDVVGKPMREAFSDVEGQGWFEIAEKVFKTGESISGKEVYASIDSNNDGIKEDYYFNFVYQPTRDSQGKISGVAIYGIDVTESVKIRKKAEESESKSRALADSMPQLVWTAGPEGNVDYYNKKREDYEGITVSDEIYKWDPIVHPDDLEATRYAWNNAVKNKEVYEMEHRIKTKEGEYKWHLSRAIPEKNSKGEIIKWFGTATDIHKQKVLADNQRFLAEASKTFASSLNYKENLKQVAELLVPYIADWCSVEILNPNLPNGIEIVAITHKNPKKVKWAYEIKEKYPTNLNDTQGGFGKVIKTGEPEFYPYISEEMIRAAATTEENYKLAMQIGYTSLIMVPLTIGKKNIGVITLVSTESKKRFNKEDLQMAQELAARASLAIQNAKLYEEVEQKEKQFSALYNSNIIGVLYIDLQGHIKSANDAFLNMIGYSKKDLKNGLRWDDLTPKEYKETDKRKVEELSKYGIASPWEKEYIKKDGTLVSVLVGCVVIDKDTTDTIAFVLDINERKEIESELRKSESKFKGLYQSNIIGIHTSDLKGNIIDANDAFLKMIDKSRNELESNQISLNSLVAPEYQKIEKQQVEKLKREKTIATYEKEYVRKDGSRTPVLIGRALFDEDKGLVISFALDISERKVLEQRKDEFISIASHELKTPLTSIKGYTQILERIINQMGDEKAKLYVQKQNIYINKLNSLISELLDVSRIQSGKLQMNVEDFNLNDLIKESIDSIKPTTSTHNLVFKEDANINLNGDKHRLEQVITNLLNNAIKYSPNADKVIVEIKKVNSKVIISIEDFGIGIKEENLKKIFERFYRVHEVSKKFSGLGIGLFICKEIIERHKGNIWVESKEGQGSKFYIELPIN